MIARLQCGPGNSLLCAVSHILFYFSNSREQKPRAVHSIIGCYGNTGKQWRVQQKKHLGRSDQTGTDVCIQQGRLRLSGELFLHVHDSFYFPFAQAS